MPAATAEKQAIPFAETTKGQVIYLDFDGAEDVTYNGPVTVEGIDVPAFSAEGTALAGGEAELIANITQQVADILSALGVQVTTELPNVPEYSTIYIGGTDDAFSIYGNFNGLAEALDIGNIDKCDNAFILR